MSNTSTPFLLQDIITEKIVNSSEQKITFSEYMSLVLYHPKYGYYTKNNSQIGQKGDFFTSSSLGKDFGELLAEQFVEMWQFLGRPNNFSLVEMGAGQGFLAQDVLTYLHDEYPNFYANLKYIIVEKSPNLIKTQKDNLALLLSNSANICWKNWQEIEENSIVGCFFSNELVDAFPVHKIIKINDEIKEVYVIIKDDLLTESTGDLSTNKIKKYFQLIEVNLLDSAYENQYQTEVNLTSLDWIEKVSNRLKKGYLLTIDYGYSAQKYYHPQRSNGTLKCYYQHRHHDNPYLNIGNQDITCHVDFTALKKQGNLCDLKTIGFTKQALFLMALGLGNRFLSLSEVKIPLPDILQRRDYLHQLINPNGLGGFCVLIQAKGLKHKEKTSFLKGLIES